MSAPARASAERRVGRPGRVIEQATLLAVESLVPVREQLSSLIAGASTLASAQARIAEYEFGALDAAQLTAAIFLPASLADMAGQIMVRELELGNGRRQMSSAPSVPFVELPWAEALREFRALGIMRTDALEELLDGYSDRSEEARQLLLEQLRRRLTDALARSVEEGLTYEQFAVALADDGAGLGISARNSAYLHTVFRTNIQTAYGAGRYRQVTDPDVAGAREYVQYRTVGDSAVRESHRVLDGMVWRVDNPAWHRVATPNGFNCRCGIVSMDAEDVIGLDVQRDIPVAYIADPRFDSPPTMLVQRSLT